MTLRCKKGDLAVVIRGKRQLGKFLTVVERYVGLCVEEDGSDGFCDGWIVTYQHGPDLVAPRGGYCKDDRDLLPIRPDLNEPSLELELQLDKLIKLGKELPCLY